MNQNDFVKNLHLYHYTDQHFDNVLNRKENKFVRSTTGQLNWLASQTRPDLSFDAFLLSTRLNRATYRDAIDSQKATKKVLSIRVTLKFGHLGKIENFQLELFPEAS